MNSPDLERNVALWKRINAVHTDAASAEARGESVPLACICFADVDPIMTELQRPYFGLGRLECDGEGGVEHQLTHGEWIAVLRDSGFEIERLVELQAPEDAKTHPFYSDIPVEWGRKWPGEEMWVARKT